MRRRIDTALRTLAVLLVVLAGASVAQDYDLDWYTVDGGGKMITTGGAYELSGTIGQPDAGTMSGGDFELIGGLWGAPAAPPPCAADLDGNGTVNAADLALLLGAWGPNPGHAADLNGDGTVDSTDLALLLGGWGPC